MIEIDEQEIIAKLEISPGIRDKSNYAYELTGDYAFCVVQQLYAQMMGLWDHFNEMAALTKHNGKWIVDYGRRFHVEADTAPMAIAKAFLELP